MAQSHICIVLLLFCFNYSDGNRESFLLKLQPDLNSGAADVDPCKSPAILTDLSGTLNYPAWGRYSRSKNCKWVIYARDPGSKIRIEFTFINIEKDNPCDDYVQIYTMTHKADSNGQHRATDYSDRLCPSNVGQLATKVYEVDSPAVLLVFRSDWIFNYRGFSLNYEILSPIIPTTIRVTNPPTSTTTTTPTETTETTATTASTTQSTTSTSSEPITSTQATSTTRPTTRATTTQASTTKATTTQASTTRATTTPDYEPFFSSKYSCDFESSCAWINQPSASLKFDVKKAKDSVWTNWGKEDHTKGTAGGSYLYLYTNRAKQGEEGILVSPELPPNPSSARCLTFYYNMLQTTSSLVVSLLNEEGNRVEILRRDGGHGKSWHHGKVSLQSYSPYFIEFSHKKGVFDVESGVAIDDISISDKPCPSMPQECGTSTFDSATNKAAWEMVDIPQESGIPDFTNDQTAMEIIGGVASERHQWPWIVRVKVFKEGVQAGTFSQCGGTLIDPKWILTAAHCFEADGVVVENPYNTLISFGEHDLIDSEEFEFTLRPEAVYIHPERANGKKDGGINAKRNDLALLKLKNPVALDSRVNTACLPKASFQPWTACFALGWGLDETDKVSPILQQLQKFIVSKKDCSYTIIDGMLCAKGLGFSDVCAGDSGGPLVCKRGSQFELAGVVSFGDKCSAKRHTSGVYSDVFHFKTWIENTMYNSIKNF